MRSSLGAKSDFLKVLLKKKLVNLSISQKDILNIYSQTPDACGILKFEMVKNPWLGG